MLISRPTSEAARALISLAALVPNQHNRMRLSATQITYIITQYAKGANSRCTAAQDPSGNTGGHTCAAREGMVCLGTGASAWRPLFQPAARAARFERGRHPKDLPAGAHMMENFATRRGARSYKHLEIPLGCCSCDQQERRSLGGNAVLIRRLRVRTRVVPRSIPVRAI
jgi:hypothetical protein